MKRQLQYMFRNDPEALELIDQYIRRFEAYDEQEQARLKRDQEALAIDFEEYVNRILEDQ